MKKVSILLTSIVLSVLISGCQTMKNAYYCSNEVDKEIPAITEQRYVRTETVCTSTGTTGKVRENGNVSIDGSTTTCKSYPIYETITLNETQRAYANKMCMNLMNMQQNNSKTAQESNSQDVQQSNSHDIQQSNSQYSESGCNEAWGRLSSSGRTGSLKYLLSNSCVGKQSFAWKDKMTNESPSNYCRQNWNAIEKSGKINDAQYLVTNQCSVLRSNGIY